jgi:demethoxyubiquinone hydroxylase (CLK1/Coq7/Cat5 family)
MRHASAARGDVKSRAITDQMRDDEVRHGAMALRLRRPPPSPVVNI